MTTLYTLDMDLIDRSKENNPSLHKIYVLENPENPWKDECNEIAKMKNDLQKSRLLQRSHYGTFVCHSDLGGGYTLLSEFNPKNYFLKLPILLRNINLETPKLHERAFPIASEANIVPSLNIAGSAIASFDQEILFEQGPEAFREEWYPETVFKIKK